MLRQKIQFVARQDYKDNETALERKEKGHVQGKYAERRIAVGKKVVLHKDIPHPESIAEKRLRTVLHCTARTACNEHIAPLQKQQAIHAARGTVSAALQGETLHSA